MSDPNPAERPEPQEDPPPDAGPGGPADVVRRDEDDLPPATPDQPRSAQVEEENVPDEIDESEEIDEDDKDDEDLDEVATDEPA